MELTATSINEFEVFKSEENLWYQEIAYESLAEKYLANGGAFPGFFVFLARKKLPG